MEKLPEAEFAVMDALWRNGSPATTRALQERLEEHNWKTPALISLLNRLMERGFLSSEKSGKERMYTATVRREEYLEFETQAFLKRVHGGSVTSLLQSMNGGSTLSEEESAELIDWFRKNFGEEAK